MPIFRYPFLFNPNYYIPQNNIKEKTQIDNEENIKKESKKQEEHQEFIFDLMGLKLYFDDILLICLLFFLYQEGSRDDELFIILILLLLS